MNLPDPKDLAEAIASLMVELVIDPNAKTVGVILGLTGDPHNPEQVAAALEQPGVCMVVIARGAANIRGLRSAMGKPDEVRIEYHGPRRDPRRN